jgi:predicted PurR-regulated permease PerM
MSKPVQISYLIMFVLLILIGWLHMATLLITALFGYFALELFTIHGNKKRAVMIYVAAATIICCGLFFFTKTAYKAMPKMVEITIPAIVEFAEKRDIDLPFTDYASLKALALTSSKDKLANLGRYAHRAVFELASFIIGLVAAASIFQNASFDTSDDPKKPKDTMYALVSYEIGRRFNTFYESFAMVMGAQVTISTINTGVTAIFLFAMGFPYASVLTGATFFCGLLPIIGNLISNTLIVGVAFTISPNMALAALLFLITIHKTEYFLNSKIIGQRIKNPMWLTLIGLVVGEKLMGVPGMILAPVVLHYIKTEASRNKPGKI